MENNAKNNKNEMKTNKIYAKPLHRRSRRSRRRWLVIEDKANNEENHKNNKKPNLCKTVAPAIETVVAAVAGN